MYKQLFELTYLIKKIKLLNPKRNDYRNALCNSIKFKKIALIILLL